MLRYIPVPRRAQVHSGSPQPQLDPAPFPAYKKMSEQGEPMPPNSPHCPQEQPRYRIVPVDSKEQLTTFVDLPWKIYRDHPLWVPPLKSQERDLLTPGKHPYWEQAEGRLFLALRDDVPVGRIAAVEDRNYNAYAQERCGAWGFFECEDDAAAAHGLFEAAAAWFRERKLEYMRGPLNPSTNYTCGMLVDSFELPPCIMMPWNPSYYPALVESWHMRKEQDLFAYLFRRETMNIPDWLAGQLEAIKERKEFSWRTSSKATLTADIHAMLEIYQQSWAENWGFTPMPLAEAEKHVEELRQVLDPQFFVLFYCNGEPAGGMLALPDMNPLLKRLDGSIGLTAPWHLWRSRSEVRSGYRLLLFGIREQYRLMGLPLLLLNFMFEQARQRPDLQWVEGSWSLEDNAMINDLIEDFSGQLYKRYRIYRRELEY